MLFLLYLIDLWYCFSRSTGFSTHLTSKACRCSPDYAWVHPSYWLHIPIRRKYVLCGCNRKTVLVTLSWWCSLAGGRWWLSWHSEGDTRHQHSCCLSPARRHRPDGAAIKSSSCNQTEHMWDKLDCAANNMDNPSQNIGERRQDLLGKWTEYIIGRWKCLAASMPRRWTVIIPVQWWNTRHIISRVWHNVISHPHANISMVL